MLNHLYKELRISPEVVVSGSSGFGGSDSEGLILQSRKNQEESLHETGCGRWYSGP